MNLATNMTVTYLNHTTHLQLVSYYLKFSIPQLVASYEFMQCNNDHMHHWWILLAYALIGACKKIVGNNFHYPKLGGSVPTYLVEREGGRAGVPC